MSNRPKGWGLVPALLLVVACNSSDQHPDEYFTPTGEALAPHQVPSFEEFRASAATEDGDLYLVEWDYPLHGEAELRAYYDARFNGKISKSAVKLTPDTGVDLGQCNATPTPAYCVDDKFYNNEQLVLRYCVSTAFGAQQATFVSSMASAAEAWQAVANVHFTYVSTDDAHCSKDDALPSSVDFKVAPRDTGGACSYWPKSERACVARTLVYNLNATFTPNTMVGVLKHELGHILGMHHEHLRADAATTACRANEMRYLSPWDSNSIMGYPASWGGCSIGGGNDITATDADGMRQLYGMPTAWHVGITI